MDVLKNPIFHGITEEEYRELDAAGCTRRAVYDKESTVFRAGDRTTELGILLSGELYIENTDLWGNRIILHHISVGEAFAETYALSRIPMMADVITSRDSLILFLDLEKLLDRKNSSRSWHMKFLQNLLQLSAAKNIAWSGRMLCISSRHIRTRIMTYLSAEAVRLGSREVVIPFNRQQMADYLNVDRSALSRELGKMQEEGILSFRKNKFLLLDVDTE